jgi:hypothetical protein
MRRIALVLVALSLLCTAPLGQGCAAALPLVTAVAGVIAEITGIVDLVDAQVQASGVLPPDVAKRIAAVRAAVVRLNDAARLGPAAYQIAVAEFERLYAELVQVVAPLGVAARPAAGRLAAAPPGVVFVPTARELRDRLMARAEVAIGEVPPASAVRDGGDRPVAQPELPRDGSPRLPKDDHGSDLQNLSVRELRATVRFAPGVAGAALRAHVSHVVGVGAEPQVRRIHARRVVAVVEDESAARSSVRKLDYRPVRYLPSHSVRRGIARGPGGPELGRDVVSAVVAADPVFAARSTAEPKPARSALWAVSRSRPRFVDLAPEPCNECFVHGNLTFPVGHGPGCLRSAGPLQSKALIAAAQLLTGAVPQ